MIGLLEQIAEQSLAEIKKMGDGGRVNIIPTGADAHARNCAAEQRVYEIAQRVLKEHLDNGTFSLVTEGFPTIGSPFGSPFNTKYTVLVDPIDGTAYYARQKARNPPVIAVSLSAVVSSPNRASSYGDVSEAVIGDAISGEIWSASQDSQSRSSLSGKLSVGVNEGVHDPLFASDFYFLENAQARLKLRHPKNPEWNRFENLNTGSVAQMMALVASGDLTAFYHMVGPTPWELAPGYLLIRQAGGYVLSADSGEELGKRPFRFEEKRVPVIAAYNEATARKILEQIKA